MTMTTPTEVLQQLADGAVMRLTQQIAKKVRTPSGCGSEWAVLNLLHRVASQVAALDLGYRARVAEVREAKPKVLCLIGADSGAVTREDYQMIAS